MLDNLNELKEMFYKDMDPGKYAGGWAYRCCSCHGYGFAIEASFPCIPGNPILPLKVVCTVCYKRWILRIEEEEGVGDCVRKH